MRPLPLYLLLVPLALSGCPDSHGRGLGADAGGDGGGCGGGGWLFCVSDCSSDAGLAPVCAAGRWTCPPGTRDLSTCPPTCHGPPPPGCVCAGTAWRCPPSACSTGIDPWNPDAPGNACSIEGAECTSGTADACGGGMFCQCRSGRWQCAVAEPDPVCWCGREPSEGDRRAEEGALCGECCPTAGGSGWPAMVCEGGRWTSAACPAIECPPVAPAACPANTAAVLGGACPLEGQSCGDPCCDSAIVCTGGRWRPGPSALCAWCPEWPCGDGACSGAQLCHQGCGPDDGLVFTCEPLPAGCDACSCIPLWGTQACEMIDGHPVVRDLGLCG